MCIRDRKKDGIHSSSFLEFLLNSDLTARRIYQLYGVMVWHDLNEIRVLQTGYKFHNLVENKNLVQKIIVDSHTKLKEASRIPGSGVVSKPCNCIYSQKTKRYYVIRIPQEYELEVHRINKEKIVNK